MRPLSVCVVLVQDYTLLLTGACCCERKNNKILVTKQGCQLTALKMQNLSGQYNASDQDSVSKYSIYIMTTDLPLSRIGEQSEHFYQTASMKSFVASGGQFFCIS